MHKVVEISQVNGNINETDCNTDSFFNYEILASRMKQIHMYILHYAPYSEIAYNKLFQRPGTIETPAVFTHKSKYTMV